MNIWTKYETVYLCTHKYRVSSELVSCKGSEKKKKKKYCKKGLYFN